jgi:hypothetical protein
VTAVGFESGAESSASVAAVTGFVSNTKSPAATMKAERLLAVLIIGNLPNLPAPGW